MSWSIVCLSPQEWQEHLPTNRQQIMSRAAAAGHEVLFVETGYFLGRHLTRLARRPGRRSLLRRILSGERVAPGITAVKLPNLAPWGRRLAPSCAFNNRIAAWRLRRRVRRLPRPVVAWIYDACAVGLATALPVDRIAYDCVDDYVEQAGSDPRRRALVRRADAASATAASVVFATTHTLEERLRPLNANTHLVPNVGDFAHFAPAADPGLAAEETRDLRHPVLGFAGNMLETKVDLALLETVADARPDWTLLLVGPETPATRAVLERLGARPNVRVLGARPYAELPRYVAAFDVALIPYVANAYTRSCFPLKLYEYLAAGKAVVATGLPELTGREPDVRLVDGLAAFVDAVEQALAASSPEDRARRASLAAANTWETRTARLLALVDETLAA